MAAEQPINREAIKQVVRDVIVEALDDRQSSLRKAIEQVAEDVAASVAAKVAPPLDALGEWPSLDEAYRRKAAEEAENPDAHDWDDETVGEVVDEAR